VAAEPEREGPREVTVLIVDDAAHMRKMIRDVLANARRFRVVGEAATGSEAVERYARLRPLLVTMDLVMPGMDGIAATRRILEIDPSARIVMCSALGQEAMVIESIAAGARDFIVKPFTPETVLRALEGASRG
jgi:two-component system chemotaxis response regulator CheY